MRQRITILLLGGLLTVALLAGIARTDFDGAIGAGAAAEAPAVAKELLGQGMSAVAPDRILLLQRRTFAPGAESGAHPAAGPTVLSVDSGAVDFAVTKGAALLTRTGTAGGETIAAGAQAKLERGDSVFYDQDVVHDVSNSGADPAVTLEARLNPVAATAATPNP